MPYPNEHAARIVAPGKFQENSFRRKNIAPGIDIIVGRLKGETTTTTQAYRFKKNKFTVAQAKEWLKEHDIKTIEFEKAIEDEEGDTMHSKEKNKKNMDSEFECVQRFDIISMNIPDEDNTDFLTSRFAITDEGFLEGRAIVTNVGVFSYLMPDGSVRRELRMPTEVLKDESLNSLRRKPLTLNHPSINNGLVNVENAEDLMVGFLGDDVRSDPYHVSMPITITKKDAIKEVQNGKRDLSCGYTARVDNRSGIWMGVPYDAIQRDIKYNHVAIVDQARAGDATKIRIDGIEEYGISISEKNDELEVNDMNLKTVKLDGVEYQAEGEVIKALNQITKETEELKKDVDDLKSNSAKIEAERDNYKDQVDKLKEELENKLDEKAIKEAVEKRLKILTAAKKAEIEFKDDHTDIEIQKAVILKVFPKAVLDGKNDEYINARFDGAVEMIEEKPNEDTRKLAVDIDNSGGVNLDSNSAREKMINNMVTYSNRSYDE